MKKENARALKNFSCNKIRKKAGDYLSKEELEMIGEKFLKGLMANDFIQMGVDSKKNPLKDEVILGDLGRDALLEHAKSLGLKPHYKLGEDKIKEMIKEKLAG